MTPHQGAGAGQAIEVKCARFIASYSKSNREYICQQDALFLNAILCSPDVRGSERNYKIDQALKTYQRVRHRRGHDVQKTSREAGLLYEFRGVHGEGDNVDKISQNLEQRMRWIWEWDIEKELEEAFRSLR